tara:strand:- start:7748 stop:8359 length:612 start_codon:yes stop_codon:yes gene_type:complete
MSLKIKIIGISGASGSGKTTVSKKIRASLNPENILIISQDSYYKDLNHLSINQRDQINFDHPDALDLKLLETHIKSLRMGNAIDQPIYHFSNHSRQSETNKILPKKIIIIEGTLVLSKYFLRLLYDMSVYVDLNQEKCLERRINRDHQERGRSKKSVMDQYENTVKPMFEKFILPGKSLADIIIRGIDNEKDISKIIEYIQKI